VTDLEIAHECLRNILDCFIKRNDYWFKLKDNDGQWVDVNEDLQDYLTEAEELLEASDHNQ
jgi:hypothetical protein